MAELTTTPAPEAPARRVNIHLVFGLLAVFFIFVAIATYSSRMAKDAPDYDSKRRAERLDILQKQREADEKALTTADWIDQTKGTVRIPIEEAIPEAITELKAKPVAMGAAIPGAAPAQPNTMPAAANQGAPAGSPQPPATKAAPSTPPAAGAPKK